MNIIATAFICIFIISTALWANENHHEELKDSNVTEELHHEHQAPHGGTLVVFGDEFAHIELVLDPQTGTLTGYVLDGEAENPVRLDQENVEINVLSLKSTGKNPEKVDLKLDLKGISSVLTGETEGNTSEFQTQSKSLIDVEQFSAVLTSITIKGQEFMNIDFKFPEGNE